MFWIRNLGLFSYGISSPSSKSSPKFGYGSLQGSGGIIALLVAKQFEGHLFGVADFDVFLLLCSTFCGEDLDFLLAEVERFGVPPITAAKNVFPFVVIVGVVGGQGGRE